MPQLGQTNFTAGVLSPKLFARTDFQKYRNGASVLENFVVLKQGGIQRRSGSRYVMDAPDQSNQGRLVPFQFSTTQNYMLALGDGVMGFARNRAPITVADTDAAVTNGTFDSGITNWTAAGGASWDSGLAAALLASGDSIEQAITVADPTIELVIRWEVKAGAAGKSHSVNFTVGSTSGATDIVSAVGAQVGHHCYSFTPGVGNTTFYIKFTNTAGTAAIDNVSFLDNTNLEITTPYSASDIQDLAYAQSADIIYFASRNHAPYKMSRTGHKRWALEEIDFTDDDFTATDDYPGTVTFHEDRLSWGGTNNDPQKFWMSKSGDFEDLTTGSNDDDAIEVTISADQVNSVRWMVSGEQLFAGTVGGEWRLFASSLDDALTPDNVNARRSTTRGSAAFPALQIDEVLLYVQRSRRKLREFAYVFEADGYKSPDLTLLADHLFPQAVELTISPGSKIPTTLFGPIETTACFSA